MTKKSIVLLMAVVAALGTATEASAAKKVVRCPKVGFLQPHNGSKKCISAKNENAQSMIEGSSRGSSGGGGGGGGASRSDMRLKHHLVRVGTTVYGLPLYDFEYKFEAGTYEGVMAQDVLKVKPEAVSVGQDGFYRVNYSMLGIRMKRIR